MAKTVFSPLFQIPSAFLNKIFSHRHDGKNEDGSAPINYAVDSGVADAYVVDLSPALTEHVAGMPIKFKASNGNTGVSTVKFNDLAVVSIKKNVSDALQAGDITAGEIVTVIYDGVNYQLRAIKKMKDYEARNADQIYQAESDGFVLAYLGNQGYGEILCDSFTPPTTLRATMEANVLFAARDHICLPVKKGDYYKYVIQTGAGHTVYWMPWY